jgi:hypothetical protein
MRVSSTSVKVCALRCLSESSGLCVGHFIPIAGSSQRMPDSALLLYRPLQSYWIYAQSESTQKRPWRPYAAMYPWNIASERRTRAGEGVRYGTKDRVVEQTSSACIRPSLASHRTGRHAALMPGKRAFPSHPSAMFPWRPSSIVVA